jgi:hypothetical protein
MLTRPRSDRSSSRYRSTLLICSGPLDLEGADPEQRRCGIWRARTGIRRERSVRSGRRSAPPDVPKFALEYLRSDSIKGLPRDRDDFRLLMMDLVLPADAFSCGHQDSCGTVAVAEHPEC